MATILNTFAYISGSETRRNLPRGFKPMFSESRNIFTSVFLSLDRYLMPNLHKLKIAAILTTFAHISGSETPRDLLLVSLPMFSGSRNMSVSVFLSLDHFYALFA